MAFNEYMHPRNVYKVRPNFKELASKYSEFEEYITIDSNNKASINFKDPDALRALTTVCLKHDFNLDVMIPKNRLIPTLPSRLNYILWIEDLLNGSIGANCCEFSGIDIGTGACCIYPLLGSKKNRWKFLATEIDAESVNSANLNVQRNNLQAMITVYKTEVGQPIFPTSKFSDTQVYDFTMCNPPFFESKSELLCISSSRPEPSSINTGSDNETIFKGGEVSFVTQMIKESENLRDKVRIFTSLLGKKNSIKPLKEELFTSGVAHHNITKFCQGNTMRWAIAWTFQPEIHLEEIKSSKNLPKKSKPKPPLKFRIPDCNEQWAMKSLSEKIINAITQLQMHYKVMKKTKTFAAIKVLAEKNTWSHQRKKRRERAKLQSETSGSEKTKTSEDDLKLNMEPVSIDESTSSDNRTDSDKSYKRKLDDVDKECDLPVNKRPKSNSDETKIDFENANCVLACTVVIKLSENHNANLELQWLQGSQGRDAMHQVLQYIKNCF